MFHEFFYLLFIFPACLLLKCESEGEILMKDQRQKFTSNLISFSFCKKLSETEVGNGDRVMGKKFIPKTSNVFNAPRRRFFGRLHEFA